MSTDTPPVSSHEEVAAFCALECRLQGRPEMTQNMLLSWQYALELGEAERTQPRKLLSAVLLFGSLIEPEKNPLTRFRDCNVRVGYSVKPSHERVPSLMQEWAAAATRQDDPLTPEEIFFEFEEIHPFRDGNGRTGVLLYCFFKRTLLHPEMPPDFWHDPRRIGLEGRGWLKRVGLAE